MSPDALDLGLAGAAAVAAGAINALAGGGTLVTFPTLLALGVGPIAANVTNTVALCPGYLGGVLGQRRDLGGQGPLLRAILPAAALGGLLGAWLVLASGERLFRDLVPYLILAACGLLAAQDTVRDRLRRRSGSAHPHTSLRPTAFGVFLAAIYGGYFGAGLSVIVLAVLGLAVAETLTRLNAAKQAIALAANVTAAALFVVTGEVVWSFALVMAVGAIAGGALGGRLASRVQPGLLRRIVVGLGVLVALAYL